MEAEIMQWINDYQRGKGGIFPYRVAEQVAIRFRITISHAIDFVLVHIRQVAVEE